MSCGANYVYFERVCVSVRYLFGICGLRGLFLVFLIYDFKYWGRKAANSRGQFQFSWGRGGEGEPDISRLVLPQNDVRTGK